MRSDQPFTRGSEELVLGVSLELAAARWKVALHDGRREKPAVHTVAQPQAAARLQAVLELIEAHRGKGALPAGVGLRVLFEGGHEAVLWLLRARARGHEDLVRRPALIPRRPPHDGRQ